MKYIIYEIYKLLNLHSKSEVQKLEKSEFESKTLSHYTNP